MEGKLRAELSSAPDEKERIAYHELIAHTDVQLAYTYALYLEHFRDYPVADVLGSPDAPREMSISQAEIDTLRGPDGAAAKPIVRRVAQQVAELHQEWLKKANDEEKTFWRGIGAICRTENEDIANSPPGFSLRRIRPLPYGGMGNRRR